MELLQALASDRPAYRERPFGVLAIRGAPVAKIGRALAASLNPFFKCSMWPSAAELIDQSGIDR